MTLFLHRFFQNKNLDLDKNKMASFFFECESAPEYFPGFTGYTWVMDDRLHGLHPGYTGYAVKNPCNLSSITRM